MIELKYKKNINERRLKHDMSNSKDNGTSENIVNFKNRNSESENSNPTNPMKKNNIGINIKQIILSNLLNGGIALTVVGVLLSKYIEIHDFMRDYEKQSNEFVTSGDITDISDKISQFHNENREAYAELGVKLDELDDEFDKLNTDVQILKYANNICYNNVQDNVIETINLLCVRDSIADVQDKLWESTDVLVIDNDTNEKITADEIAGKKIILSYTQGNQEVLFCGQFSKNNRWDDECTVNVYENNKLKIVTEATYDDGVLISYRQVYAFTTKAGVNVWSISDRKPTDEGNYGYSWNYYKDDDIELDFSLKDATIENVYTVNKVEHIIDRTHVEGLYHGYTVDGLYNDKTGEAYLIKFSKYDETVKTLYVGGIEDGDFVDTTGNAFYIVRDDEKVGSKYMYYKGIFKDGHPSEEINEENSKHGLDLDTINELTESIFFKCELNWYGFCEL